MANLTDTYNITLHRKHTFKDGGAYYSVPVFGDGNCAFNGFALCLIDLIKRDQLTLSKKYQQRLIDNIQISLSLLRERIKHYRGEKTELVANDYADVANDLEKFVEFMSQVVSYDDFVGYVKGQHGRHALAALQVGLAPALRHLGVDAHIKALKTIKLIDQDMLNEVSELYRDGENAGQDILTHLANVFGVNLVLYNKQLGVRADLSEMVDDAPSIAVLYSPGHYDCLLPVQQVESNAGIAADLAGLHIELVDKLNTQNGLLKNKFRLYNHEIAEAAAVATEASKAVLDIVIPSDECLRMRDATKLMTLSTETVAIVKRKLEISDAKLDSLDMKHKLQKELLSNGVSDIVGDISEDEIIARTMQNAEILSFYEKNHAGLAPSMPYLKFRGELVNSTRRPGLFNHFQSAPTASSADAANISSPKKH